jgi:uncharacterized iron-regulated membrane protein
MTWTNILALLKLTPSKLNIALLLLGISGMIWSYKQGQAKIDELQTEMRTMQRENKIEKDSLYKSAQIAEALCNERVLDGQKELINRLDVLNADLRNELGRRSVADNKRKEAATYNGTIIKSTTKKLERLKNGLEIKATEN